MEGFDIYTLGIDIGSTSSKAVILKDGKEIISNVVIPLGTGTIGPSIALEKVFENIDLSLNDMAYIVATGYGRMKCSYANEQVSELSCHARGIHELLPDVRTVIDIGGQDAKVLRVDAQGYLENFQMNDKCAAGTGRFLEVMAKVLNVDIDKLGAISEEADNPVKISNTCAVFAESEVISHLSSDVGIANIAAGIHNSVAQRVAGMAGRIGMEPAFTISGGVALNTGVVRALSRELGYEITVHPLCQLAGALGAAKLAAERVKKN